MSSSSEHRRWLSPSLPNSTSRDDSITQQQCPSLPPPLPPRNSRSVMQSLTGFPGSPSPVRRHCGEFRNISCGDLTFYGGEDVKTPIGTMTHAAEPELGIPEFSEPSIAILDTVNLWPHLEPSIKACMPLKSLELKSSITRSNVVINELPIRMSVHATAESLHETWKKASVKVWNWYKAPFAVMYVVTADSQDHYRIHIRPKLRQLLDTQESASLMKEGWLILYIGVTNRHASSPEKGSEAMHSKVFGWLSADFCVKSPGDRTCFVPVCIDDSEKEKPPVQQPEQQQQVQQRVQDYDLAKRWNGLATQIGTVIVNTFNDRLRMYESDLSLLDEKRMDPEWNFSQFFLVKDALALMLRQLGLNTEALLKYQELAASIIMLSNEVQTTMQKKVVDPDPSTALHSGGGDTAAVEEDPECGRLLFGLPSQCIPKPHLVFDVHSMAFRERLLSRTLHSVVFESQLYIFAREMQLLLETCSLIEMVGCAFSFIPAYYRQLRLRNDVAPAQAELWAIKASWDIVTMYPRYQHYSKKLSRQVTRYSATTDTEYDREKNEVCNTSGQLCEVLFFMIDRLMGCARQLSSFDCLSRSPVWDIYAYGFWRNAQTWTPAAEQLVMSLRNVQNVQNVQEPPPVPSKDVVIAEELLFWGSDESGEVHEDVDSITTTKSISNPMETLLSFGIMSKSNAIFQNSDRNEIDDLLPRYPQSLFKSSFSSLDLGSFASSSLSSNSEHVVDPDENNNGTQQQQQPHCRGLEIAHDLDLVFLQITCSLIRYLMKARKLRTASIIQQRRCDVLISHGNWDAVIRLLEGDVYPQNTSWHLLEFHRLQRLGQCYWNIGSMDSFFYVVLRMCRAYKEATTGDDDELSELDRSSSMIALGGILSGYIEACSSVLLLRISSCDSPSFSRAPPSVNMNLRERNLDLAYIAGTPQLLLLNGHRNSSAGRTKDVDNVVIAGDEIIITCNISSHLPCEIKIDPLPILTLKVIYTRNCQRGAHNTLQSVSMAIMEEEDWNSSKGGETDDEEGTVVCVGEYVMQQHSSGMQGEELFLMPGMNSWEFKVRPVQGGALVGHNLTMNWGGSVHFSHSFSMPQHFSSSSRCSHRHDGQFIHNIKPFVPSSTMELLVPPFLPYEEPSSVIVRIFSNKDALSDVLLTLFCERGNILLQKPEAWWDNEEKGGERGTNKLLPISVSTQLQTDDHHDGVDKDEKKEDSSIQNGSGAATTSQAAAAAAASTVHIQLEKPIPPESVVKLKLELMATTDRTKTGNFNSMAPQSKDDVLKCCVTAIHTRGNMRTPGVKCSETIETTRIPINVPFSSRVKGMALMDDSVCLQASLECRSPIALNIISHKFVCENIARCWRFGGSAPAGTALNLIDGQTVQPSQKLFLCTSLVKGGAMDADDDDTRRTVTVTDNEESCMNATAAAAPFVKLLLQYEIHQDGGGFRDGVKKDIYLYELLMPVESFCPSNSVATITCDVVPCLETHSAATTTAAASIGQSSSSLMVVEGESQSRGPMDTSSADDQPAICQFGVPHPFNFSVSSNRPTRVVLHYELDTGGEWMVCGNSAGYVTLQENVVGKPVTVTRCDLVPLKCGLVQLPRLKVTSEETTVTVVRDQGTLRNPTAVVLPTGFVSGISSFVGHSIGVGSQQPLVDG